AGAASRRASGIVGARPGRHAQRKSRLRTTSGASAIHRGPHMKIAKTTAHTLRVPYQFPLIKDTQYALTTFVEIETDDGLKGHAFSVYPQRYSISDLINREVAPVIKGLDPTRPEEVRTTLFWKIANKHFMGIWSMAASMIDVALWDVRGKALKQPI